MWRDVLSVWKEKRAASTTQQQQRCPLRRGGGERRTGVVRKGALLSLMCVWRHGGQAPPVVRRIEYRRDFPHRCNHKSMAHNVSIRHTTHEQHTYIHTHARKTRQKENGDDGRLGRAHTFSKRTHEGAQESSVCRPQGTCSSRTDRGSNFSASEFLHAALYMTLHHRHLRRRPVMQAI